MAVSRDEARSKIFQQQFTSIPLVMNGVELEVRQPTLGAILAAQEKQFAAGGTPDIQDTIVDLMVSYCYLAGTEERVFEVADKDSILALPFNSEVMELSKAVNAAVTGNSLGTMLKDATKSTAE